jgi:hypothetical protein
MVACFWVLFEIDELASKEIKNMLENHSKNKPAGQLERVI